jgi:hypothetical protein
MAKKIQTSFVSGEISPRVGGRVDLKKYASSLKTCKNGVVLPQGAVERRPGFKYIAESAHAGTDTYAPRLIPFVFSTTQAYILEFSHQKIRVYKDQAQVLTGGGATYELDTHYHDHDLATLDFAQTADTMYIVGGHYFPHKLTRTDHNAWTLTAVSFTNQPTEIGSYQALTDITQANPGVVTAAGHGLSDGDVVYIDDVVGMTEVNNEFYIVANKNPGDFQLTTYPGGANVDTSGYGAYVSGGTITAQDQPTSVTFFEERVCYSGFFSDHSGSTSYPQTVIGSEIGNYDVFTVDADADDPFSYTIAADEVNVIRWLVSTKKLLLGTTGGEWWMAGSGTDAPIAHDDVVVRRETTHGSEEIKPIVVGGATIFVQRLGRNLREFAYKFDDDAFFGTDLNIMAEHLTKYYGITAIAYQQTPYQVIWCVRSDGALLGLTYMREHEVIAWHQHNTGEDKGDKFESIAVIPGSTSSELWAVVKRRVNGVDKRYIEVMQSNDWGFNYESRVITQHAKSGLENDSQCSLLIHSNTTAGSQVFTDSSPNGRTITVTNDAQHKTTKTPKFGTSYIELDGTGDDLRCANSADFNFGDGDFTVEFWLHGDGQSSKFLMGLWNANNSDRGWAVNDNAGNIDFVYTTDGTVATEVALSGTVSLSAGWNHVRITRNSTIMRTFINGTVDVEYTCGTDSIHASGREWGLGYYINMAGGAYGNEFFDEIAIVKGRSLSNGNYTPPTEAYDDTVQFEQSTLVKEITSEDAFFVDSGGTYNDQATITGATRANPVVVTAVAHGFSDGDYVFIQQVDGMSELNGNTYKVANKAADTFELTDTSDVNVDGTAYDAYLSGGTADKMATNITGLDHLEGRTVGVFADGEIQDNEVVAGGGITLDDRAAKVHVGLNYTTDIETLRLDDGDGGMQGDYKRIVNIFARLFDTIGGSAGPDEDNLDDFVYDNYAYPRGTVPEMFTGDKQISIEDTYNTDGHVLIRQDKPGPLTLIAVIPEFENYE